MLPVAQSHRSLRNQEKNLHAVADELLNISRQVNAAIRSDRARLIALNTTLSEQKRRIFEQGLKTDGSKIGKYSKAYGEKKTRLGRNPGFINFRLTDEMMNDYRVIVKGQEYGFGFNSNFNAQKADWLTERFGTVFDISDAEFDVFTGVMFFELDK